MRKSLLFLPLLTLSYSPFSFFGGSSGDVAKPAVGLVRSTLRHVVADRGKIIKFERLRWTLLVGGLSFLTCYGIFKVVTRKQDVSENPLVREGGGGSLTWICQAGFVKDPLVSRLVKNSPSLAIATCTFAGKSLVRRYGEGRIKEEYGEEGLKRVREGTDSVTDLCDRKYTGQSNSSGFLGSLANAVFPKELMNLFSIGGGLNSSPKKENSQQDGSQKARREALVWDLFLPMCTFSLYSALHLSVLVWNLSGLHFNFAAKIASVNMPLEFKGPQTLLGILGTISLIYVGWNVVRLTNAVLKGKKEDSKFYTRRLLLGDGKAKSKHIDGTIDTLL